jgi:hypothetical protein
VQQLQQDGWTAGSSSSSKPTSSAKQQQAADARLQASVHSAAAAGLSPHGASALLSLHEQCGYEIRNEQLRQVCKALAAAAQ